MTDNYSGIHHQPINANNFKLKSTLIKMVQQNQYGGLAHEDPNVHLAIFLEIANTVKMNGVIEDVIRMRLFLFSLRDRAREWLQSLQPGSINSREEFAQRFLSKFFLPSKTSQLRGEIAQFRQMDFESKITDGAHWLLEEMSTNNCQWTDKRSIAKKAVGIHEVDPIVSLSAQVFALANQITAFTPKELVSK